MELRQSTAEAGSGVKMFGVVLGAKPRKVIATLSFDVNVFGVIPTPLVLTIKNIEVSPAGSPVALGKVALMLPPKDSDAPLNTIPLDATPLGNPARNDDCPTSVRNPAKPPAVIEERISLGPLT
jgi:hypothetical protein